MSTTDSKPTGDVEYEWMFTCIAGDGDIYASKGGHKYREPVLFASVMDEKLHEAIKSHWPSTRADKAEAELAALRERVAMYRERLPALHRPAFDALLGDTNGQ